MAVAGFCFSGRNVFPDWLSGFVANVCLLSGGALWLLGTQQFFGRPRSTRFASILIFSGAAGVAIGWLIVPNYLLRLFVMIACMTCLNAAQLGIILRYGARHYSTYFVALALAIQILVMVVRGVSAGVSGQDAGEFFSADPIQIIYHAAFGIVTLLVAVGYVILATRRLNAELAWYATRDPLTSILNRRAFSQVAECHLRCCLDDGRPFSAFIIDLDHFKRINDGHGHGTGDQVLIDCCRKVESRLPESAAFGRLGGEEFIVAVADMSESEAMTLAETVRQAIADRQDLALPAYTCSIGVATAHDRSTTLSRLMAAADDALYLAKHAGRNMVKHIRLRCDNKPRDAVLRTAPLTSPLETKA